MRFELTDQQRAWVEEVRSFLASHVGAEERAALLRGGGEWSGDVVRRFRQALADRGWLTLSWPTEHGGMGRPVVDQVLLMDEFAYHGAPAIDLTSASVAPTIIRSGTPEQRERWLPRIARGEVEFAIGYSEPDAGSDLARLRTRAVLDGDEWVIDGEKIWNTGAEYATHEFLAVRTDPEAPRHRGISVLIVPIDTPGITVRPIDTWRGMRTNQVAFEGVRVPRENLLGEVNQGWRYVTQALAFERIAIGITGGLRRLLEDVVEEAGRTVVGGIALLERPGVARRLAELVADLELARLLNHRAAWMVDAGRVPDAEASMTKVFTSELHARTSTVAMELFGPTGQLDPYDDDAPVDGRLALTYRDAPYLRFGGGTNEIQRDIIAQRGYGLPR